MQAHWRPDGIKVVIAATVLSAVELDCWLSSHKLHLLSATVVPVKGSDWKAFIVNVLLRSASLYRLDADMSHTGVNSDRVYLRLAARLNVLLDIWYLDVSRSKHNHICKIRRFGNRAQMSFEELRCPSDTALGLLIKTYTNWDRVWTIPWSQSRHWNLWKTTVRPFRQTWGYRTIDVMQRTVRYVCSETDSCAGPIIAMYTCTSNL